MVKQIFLGLFVAALGGAVMFYSQSIADAFGRVGWFERNLGSTRNGYVMVGFGVVVVGFLILFGIFPTSSSVTSIDTSSDVVG